MPKIDALAWLRARFSRPLEALLGETLALIAFAIYIPSIWGGLLWDDDFLLFNYPAQWSALRDIWAGRNSPDFLPLAQSAFWLQARIFGRDVRGYHFVTILLHAIAVVLLWHVLKRLSVPGAWLGALLFALHPVNVESVAWIAELKNTFSLALYAAALLAYLRFEERPTIWRYLSAFSLFVSALLAKTAVVMLPAVFLLCAWWQRGRITRKDLLRTVPFFAASLALGLVTIYFQTHAMAIDHRVVNGTLWQRTEQAGVFFGFYLAKAVFPYPLLSLYPAFLPGGVLPDLAIVAVAIALWINRKTPVGRALCFALAYYALSLAPALGFISMAFWTYAPVADRFQYFGLIGITALAGAVIVSIARKPVARAALAAALCAILATATILQEQPYHSQVALWTRQLQYSPDSPRALDLLGTALLAEGRFSEALEYLQQANAIDPGDPAVPRDLGEALLGVGRLEEAEIQLKESHRRLPDSLATMDNLALAYLKEHRLDEAEGIYRDTVRAHPNNPDAHDGLGEVLAQRGKFQDAIHEIQIALALNPNRTNSRLHLENVLQRQSDQR